MLSKTENVFKKSAQIQQPRNGDRHSDVSTGSRPAGRPQARATPDAAAPAWCPAASPLWASAALRPLPRLHHLCPRLQSVAQLCAEPGQLLLTPLTRPPSPSHGSCRRLLRFTREASRGPRRVRGLHFCFSEKGSRFPLYSQGSLIVNGFFLYNLIFRHSLSYFLLVL